MKNFKIKYKLMLSFCAVAFITFVAGAVGIAGLRAMDRNEELVYGHAVEMAAVDELLQNLQAQRAGLRGVALQHVTGAEYTGELARLDSLMEDFSDGLNRISGESLYRDELDRVAALYERSYMESVNDVIRGTANDDPDGIQRHLHALVEPTEEMLGILEELAAGSREALNAAMGRDERTANRFVALQAALVFAAVAVAVFFAFYVSWLIAAPLGRMAREVRRLATGDCNVNPQIDQRDEIGVVDKALWEIVSCMLEQEQAIVRMAQGDYTGTIRERSEQDTVNKALNRLVANQNTMMREVHSSAIQVDTGSQQVAQAAQNLATGSSQQSATIQQFSAVIAQVQSAAEATSATALQSLEEVREAGGLMERCSAAMERMVEAMAEIDEKSHSISGVIKVIEDIAFQTNILALNAAVEAARAGQNGKGFAVVADEVRNLASKSAEAARETAGLIAQSLGSVAQGSSIVEQVNGNIREVAELAGKNARTMEQLNEASLRQRKSMDEISGGISQISQVVQANSATAEEAAASSEQMAAQAATLSGMIGRFRLKEDVERAGGELWPGLERAVEVQIPMSS